MLVIAGQIKAIAPIVACDLSLEKSDACAPLSVVYRTADALIIVALTSLSGAYAP
jgi:hypothetical protein